MEIYVPKEKRRWGYYVLPILHGDRLIGRIDPAVDRARGVLQVHAIHVEPDAPLTREAGRAVAASLPFLARAKRAIVLTVVDGGAEEAERLSALRVERALRRHRPELGVRVLRPDGGDAAATLLAAAESQTDARLAGVVSESSFTSFADTARHHVKTFMPVPTFPFAPLLINFTAWRMGFRVSDFDALAAVRRIRQPILFIGSGNDRRMPNATVLEPLYAAAQHPGKRKLIVPNAMHGRAFDAAPDEYVKALTDFLRAVEDESPR
jgi:pimeloyl-ACP methyl ester carboxylesterase